MRQNTSFFKTFRRMSAKPGDVPPLRQRNSSIYQDGEKKSRLRSTVMMMVPQLTTLSVRTYDWVREIRDGHTAHQRTTQMFLFLNDPAGTAAAYVYMMFMNVLSIIAVTTFVLQESHLHNSADLASRETRSDVIWYVNLVMLLTFGLELPARLLVHPSWYRLSRDVWFWIDLLVMIPLAIRVFLGSSPEDFSTSRDVTEDGWFRTLEALTSLRLLRLARYFHGGMLLGQALTRSASALIIPFYFLATITMLFGGLLYACEGVRADMVGPNATLAADEQVLSMPDAIWLMFITMTTVGYGDYSPKSDAGRGVAMVATLCGLINIALPLAIVGDNFIEVRGLVPGSCHRRPPLVSSPP